MVDGSEKEHNGKGLKHVTSGESSIHPTDGFRGWAVTPLLQISVHAVHIMDDTIEPLDRMNNDEMLHHWLSCVMQTNSGFAC